jgi:hypothetical protein
VTGLDQADQGTVKATPPASMTYTVTASTKDNCQTDTAAVSVVVHPLPQVDAGQDQTVSTGSVVQLQATGSSDVTEWSWKPADYLNCTHCANPVSTPRQPVTYADGDHRIRMHRFGKGGDSPGVRRRQGFHTQYLHPQS